MNEKRRMRMTPRGITRIHSTKRDFAGGYHLTVPSHLARLVGGDRLFQVELTDEGILYRFVDGDGPKVPAWLGAA